jgi:hypothetical protein
MFPLVFLRRLRRGLWRNLLWRDLRRHLRNDLQCGRRRRRRRRRRDLNRLLLNSGLFDGVLTLMTLVRLAALRAWPRCAVAGRRVRRLRRSWRALLLTFLAVIFLVLFVLSLFALRGRLIRGILRDDHRAIVGSACCREAKAKADSANNTGRST